MSVPSLGDLLALAEQTQQAASNPLLKYTGNREEDLRIVLMDENENILDNNLDGVSEVKLDLSIFDTIRTGGAMSVSNSDDIWWLDKRIKIIYQGPDGDVSLGVYIPASPTGTRSTQDAPRSIELYDKLLVPHQDAVDRSYEIAAGTNVVSKIRQLIESTGESLHSIEDSGEILKASMLFLPGTTKLQIINKLLDAINYFSLWCDGNGVYRASKYVPPTERSESWNFMDDPESSIYLTEFEDDNDTFNIPNKIICVSRVEGETEPFVSTAANFSETDPFSYYNRGRWITEIYKDIEASSQTVLDEIAKRYLRNAASITRSYVIKHAWVPIDLNNLVMFGNEENNIAPRACVVQKMSIDLTLPGIIVTTTLREVDGPKMPSGTK